MNCTPCQVMMLQTGELLQALRAETLTPETALLARRLAGALHVAGFHVVDQQTHELFGEPQGRARHKELK